MLFGDAKTVWWKLGVELDQNVILEPPLLRTYIRPLSAPNGEMRVKREVTPPPQSVSVSVPLTPVSHSAFCFGHLCPSRAKGEGEWSICRAIPRERSDRMESVLWRYRPRQMLLDRRRNVRRYRRVNKRHLAKDHAWQIMIYGHVCP